MEKQADISDRPSTGGMLKYLIERRTKMNLPPEWVAERAGINPDEYLQIENGIREPSNEEHLYIEAAIEGYEDSIRTPFEKLANWLRDVRWRIKYNVGDIQIHIWIIAFILLKATQIGFRFYGSEGLFYWLGYAFGKAYRWVFLTMGG